MAGELKLSASMRFDKSEVHFDSGGMSLQDLSLTVSGSNFHHAIQSIGTSAAALGLGSVTTCGYAIFRNLSANTITIRSGSGGADVIKLKTGESSGPVRLATNTPYAIATVASSRLEYVIVED